MDNVEDVIGFAAEPSDELRASASELARALIVAEDAAAAAEAAWIAAKREVEVANKLLADALDDIHQEQFTLTGGFVVSVKDTYVCGQLDDAPDDLKKKDKRPLVERLAALDLLEASGHGDIAKRVIAVTLGAKSDKIAAELIELLRSHRLGNRLNIDQRRVVWWNSLAAFAEAQVKANEFDENTLQKLGVSKLRRAKVTRPKSASREF